jgi:hypothetical protein
VVDLDLEKFFDRVNHDKLMAKLAERVSNQRILELGLCEVAGGGVVGQKTLRERWPGYLVSTRNTPAIDSLRSGDTLHP